MTEAQRRLALYEDESEALRELVREIGGTKVAGHALRPDLAPDRAGGWLKDCLNPERAERLQPSQLFALLRMARERGIHGPAEYLLHEIGYRIEPIEPGHELAELQRQFIAATAAQRSLVERIERLTRAPLSAVPK